MMWWVNDPPYVSVNSSVQSPKSWPARPCPSPTPGGHGAPPLSVPHARRAWGTRQVATRGMTLVEAVIALLLLGVVLFLLVGSATWTRQHAKDHLAWDMLVALNKSLAAYVQSQGGYPPARTDQQPHEAITALLGDEDAAGYLLSLPPALHGRHNEKHTLLDPWARPLRYLTTACDDTGRVEANEGRPVFVLADGRGCDDIAKGD